MTYRATERLHPIDGTRIELEAEVPFATLRAAFEAEVPELDTDLLRSLLGSGADWSTLTRSLAGPGSHRLVRFWSGDPTAVMRAGGVDLPSVGYLIGDYATAARMFRHDAGTALYTPFRVELHAAGEGRTVLSADQPSAPLRNFGNNKITQAGYELDRMLGDLLEDLGLPRPSVLRL
ncbi:hypothetical protein [uncultured Leifsonia sp.]|uniref:hypothetical protein n=1 Tax=uncultured Leifsonia sp. TaxID=340359 RepID=UPI0025DD8EFF|nr:hypothetical protein [uncultured Leifsonia sp.]